MGLSLAFCVGLAVVVGCVYGHDVIYTHFFYIPILLAGLWYPRHALAIAIALGAVHLTCDFIAKGVVSPQPVLRSAVLIATAGIMRFLALRRQAMADEVVRLARLQAMSLMAGSFAHDLSQPLAAILSNAQAAVRFLGAPAPDLAEIRAILDEIIADDKRAGAIIQHARDVLNYGEKSVRAMVDINAVVRDAARILRREFAGRAIDLELRLAAAPLEAPVDVLQIRQVLVNLLLNAAQSVEKASASNRCVVVATVRDASGRARITVDDNGPGLPANCLSRVFDLFFSTKTDGLGLGLPLSRAIVMAHDGKIWAEHRPGGGARFALALPGPPLADSAIKQRHGNLFAAKPTPKHYEGVQARCCG